MNPTASRNLAGRKAARTLHLFRPADVGCGAVESDNVENVAAGNENVGCGAVAGNGADGGISIGGSGSGSGTGVRCGSGDSVSSAIYFPHSADGRCTKLMPEHLTPAAEFDHSTDSLGEIEEIEEALERHPAVVRQKSAPPRSTCGTAAATATTENTATDNRTAEKNYTATGSAAENLSTTPPSAYPLAVELQPFKNKVGGHTAIFKFSHRAVCKALVNREDRWYENIEHEHPELLKFMPKYIGVLNVRYSTFAEEGGPDDGDTGSFVAQRRAMALGRMPQAGPGEELVPEVVLADNRHILPASLWRDAAGGRRSGGERKSGGGSTTVNRRLQELVLTEVFAPIREYAKRSRERTRAGRRRRVLSTDLGADHGLTLRQRRYSAVATGNPAAGGSGNGSSCGKSVGGGRSGSGDGRSSADSVEPSSVHSDDIKLGSMDDEPFPDRETIVSSIRGIKPQKNDEEAVEADGGIFAMEPEEDEAKTPSAATKAPHNRLRKHTAFERFILLEDLTTGMQHPCVLDMKMGTRQYGVEAVDAKRDSQRRKCRQTTSRKLGTRICGMQVWDLKRNSFINRDKYFGRRVKAGEELVRSLSRFLYDGLRLYSVVKHLPGLIRSLSELVATFTTLNDYRMYGSSILLMYDSSQDSRCEESTLMVRMIDFAQCVIGTDQIPDTARFPPTHKGCPDYGYLRGLCSLRFYFTLMFARYTGYEYRDYDTAMILLKKLRENPDSPVNAPCEWLDTFDNAMPCPYDFDAVPDEVYDNTSE